MSFAHQSGAGGVSVHGLLSGLDADDHSQYALADTSRPSPWVAAADLNPLSLADLGTRLHSDLDNLAYADAAHTGFCALAGPQTITGEKRIDSAVGLRFGHAAGPLLQGPASGATLALTGDLAASGNVGLHSATPSAAIGVLAEKPNPPTFSFYRIKPYGTSTGAVIGLQVEPAAFTMGSNTGFRGVVGSAVCAVVPGNVGGFVQGLNFFAGITTGAVGTTFPEVTAMRTQPALVSYRQFVTDIYGYLMDGPFILGGGPSVATTHGLYVGNQGPSATQVDAYGVRILDMTANTGFRRLIEAGPATPNLRLLANAPPNAGLATEGDSQLFLAWMENGAVNLRRVRWRQQSSLLATDKVLITA
jgi:hypothetical protein